MPRNHDNSKRKKHCPDVGKDDFRDDIQNLSKFMKMKKRKIKK